MSKYNITGPPASDRVGAREAPHPFNYGEGLKPLGPQGAELRASRPHDAAGPTPWTQWNTTRKRKHTRTHLERIGKSCDIPSREPTIRRISLRTSGVAYRLQAHTKYNPELASFLSPYNANFRPAAHEIRCPNWQEAVLNLRNPF